MTRFALNALTEAVNSDVAALGLRPTAERRRLPLSILRGAIEQRNLTVDSLVDLAESYDLEFYLGPRREAEGQKRRQVSFGAKVASVYGWASCGPKGEGPARQDNDRSLPIPNDVAQSSHFYAIAKGHSMRQEGIPSGAIVLINTARDPAVGDRVWFRDVVGMTSLKRLTNINGDTVTLRGWMVADSGRVSSFDITVPASGIEAIHPVVAVFDQLPTAGQDQDILPDPRVSEFGETGVTRDTRIAAALGLDLQADQDAILQSIAKLQSAALDAPPIASLRHSIDDLYDALGAVKLQMERPIS